MNEDRARFLTALGLEWCSAGNHAATDAWEWRKSTYCPKHLPPSPPPDPPAAGRCNAYGGHWADRIWYVPLDGSYYCRTHLTRIIWMALWRA